MNESINQSINRSIDQSDDTWSLFPFAQLMRLTDEATLFRWGGKRFTCTVHSGKLIRHQSIEYVTKTFWCIFMVHSVEADKNERIEYWDSSGRNLHVYAYSLWARVIWPIDRFRLRYCDIG